MKNKILFLWFACLFCNIIFSQNNRLSHNNTIGWYNYFGTIKLSKKFDIHTEYQWRRDNVITDWQQSLLRVGVNYNLNPRVLFRAGYAWIETFSYGDVPINAFGKDFTEHRFFQMAQLSHREGKVDFSHRFMLEQRFVGRYSSATENKEDEFPLLHRMRYMFRMQIPLRGNSIVHKTPYLALYDEIFIGFGNNVNVNVFDQNRVGILVGYRINQQVRVEGGYLNQIVQFGRQINNQNIFQFNNGFIVNLNFSFNVMKKE